MSESEFQCDFLSWLVSILPRSPPSKTCVELGICHCRLVMLCKIYSGKGLSHVEICGSLPNSGKYPLSLLMLIISFLLGEGSILKVLPDVM